MALVIIAMQHYCNMREYFNSMISFICKTMYNVCCVVGLLKGGASTEFNKMDFPEMTVSLWLTVNLNDNSNANPSEVRYKSIANKITWDIMPFTVASPVKINPIKCQNPFVHISKEWCVYQYVVM